MSPTRWWYLSIVLVAANLRPVISSVPPLVDSLAETLGLSAVAAGALTTLPVVCMGAFAPLAGPAADRLGERRVVTGALALIAVGAAMRASFGLAGLYAGTALAGAGIAVAGTLLPTLVRSHAPRSVGPVTGLYTATLITGAFLAAGATEPLRQALGWTPQAVLLLWSLPALLALLCWLVPPAASALAHTTPRQRPALRRSARDHGERGSPWRSRRAWLGTLFLGAQSLLFYTALAWLGALYVERGMAVDEAGLLLAVFSVTQVATALGMPMLAHRYGKLRGWIALSVGLTTLSLGLVAAVPLASPWAWAALVGLGMGGNLSLALTILTQAAPTPAAAARHTGMAFLVGYLLAAVGPVAGGALRDATGTYAPVFAALTTLGLITLSVGLAAAPRAIPIPIPIVPVSPAGPARSRSS